MPNTATAPTVKFHNGQNYPAIGFGTWQTEGDEMVDIIKMAIDVGYRMIDTAFQFNNEQIVGKAIRAKIAEGVIKREDIFIATKLWMTHHDLSQIIPSCKKSLELLGLDYIDLYLIHCPFAFKDDQFNELNESVSIEKKWAKMEEIVELGLAKSIGLSNFNSEQIDRILKVSKIQPVVNQVECHPYLNQKKLIEYCNERNIIITAYAPLGSPGIIPDSQCYDKLPKIMDEPIIKRIAEKHKKSPAQIVLRYVFQLGAVPIPKSSNPQRIKENFNIFNFYLDSDDVEAMDSLNKNLRAFSYKPAKPHKEYPFNIEF